MSSVAQSPTDASRGETDGRRSDPVATAPAEAARPAGLIVLALAIAAVVAIFWPSLVGMADTWDKDANFSHGFVVPFASLAFAAMAWRRAGPPVSPSVSRRDFVLGVVEILVGLGLYVVSIFITNYVLDTVALICVLRGIILCLGGSRANRAYGFSILFLIFMAPLPPAWYQPIAIQMQQWVSVISTQFLEVVGLPVVREGYLITLAYNHETYTMEVGQACSGLRQLTAVLALAVAIAHLSGRGRGFGWTLALLSIPIAIAVNCLRVMFTGLIMMWFGREYAEGVFHTMEGLVTVGLAAVLVALTAWGLGKLWDRWGGESKGEESQKSGLVEG